MVIAGADEAEATLVKYCPDQVLPRRRRIPPCLREDAVGESESELDQPLVAAAGELVEGVRALKEVDVAIEPLDEGGSANIARHLLDERHELDESLTPRARQGLPAGEATPGSSPARPGSPARSAPRSSGPARAAQSEGLPGPSSAGSRASSSHVHRDGRVEVADHEPRLIGAPLPRLGDPDVGGLADAQHLAGDLTPSLGRYTPPIRALEHGKELAVRVAETGSDLDLHAHQDTTGRRRSGWALP